MNDWKGAIRTKALLEQQDTTEYPDLVTFLVVEDPKVWYCLDKASTETADGDNYLTALPAGRWVKAVGGGGGGGGATIAIGTQSPIAANIQPATAGEIYIEEIIESNTLDTADFEAQLSYVTHWKSTGTNLGDWQAFTGSEVTILVTLDNLGDLFNLTNQQADLFGFQAQYTGQTTFIFADTSGYGNVSLEYRYKALLSQSDPWIQYS